MKVFSVVGFTQSGKTTTIEEIIKELKRRRYSVGSLKDIHYEKFAIDIEGSNSYRHRQAGAELVTARGLFETDILYPEQLDVYTILKFYDHDYVVLEGISEGNFPKIVTADKLEDIEAKRDKRTMLISGKIADHESSYDGIQAISALQDVVGLVDFIEDNVFDMLPNFDKKCCGLCGMSCEDMAGAIVKGHKKRSDCILTSKNISLSIDDKKIDMVPFVQDILRNNILAIVKELDGYKEGADIEISLGLNTKER